MFVISVCCLCKKWCSMLLIMFLLCDSFGLVEVVVMVWLIMVNGVYGSGLFSNCVSVMCSRLVVLLVGGCGISVWIS